MRLWLLTMFISASCWGLDASVSDRFHQLWRSGGEVSVSQTARLQRYNVLLVPGFLSEAFMGRPFRPQMRVLKRLEIPYTKAMINSSETIEENAKAIALSIRQSERPVILMSHSKGTLDTIEALVQNPDLIDKVAGWIMLQSPVYGSSLIEALQHNTLHCLWMNCYIHFGGASSKVLKQITIKARDEYMATHEKFLATVGERLPIINVMSYHEEDWKSEIIRNVLGDQSDGAVSLQHAVFPNAKSIVISDFEHGDFHREGDEPNRAESMTAVLLKLLNDEMQVTQDCESFLSNRISRFFRGMIKKPRE